MKVVKLISILLLTTIVAFSQTINWEFAVDEKIFKIKKNIFPEKSIYGVSFGASEIEMVKAFGPPQGVIYISETKKGLLYGKSHVFIFKKRKFSEVFVSDSLFDLDFGKEFDEHPYFDAMAWKIDPGLKKDMTFESVMEALGVNGVSPTSLYTYQAGDASVSLKFIIFVESVGGARTYKLRSVWIKSSP